MPCVVLVAVPCASRDHALGQKLHAARRAAVRLVARHLGMHRADVGGLFCRLGEQLHAALGAAAGLRAHHLRVHRADVDDLDALGHAHVHLRDERERLDGRRLQVRLDPLALLSHVTVCPQLPELISERLLREVVRDVDRRKPVGALGRSVLELELAGIGKEDVDDDTLGGSEQNLLDQLLPFVVACVGTDQLHLCAGQCDVEDARIGGVREVEAHDLAAPGLERKVSFTRNEHHVAEPAHRHVRRLRLPKCCDLPFLDQDVVERHQELAVGWRPVVGLARGDEDVPVEA